MVENEDSIRSDGQMNLRPVLALGRASALEDFAEFFVDLCLAIRAVRGGVLGRRDEGIVVAAATAVGDVLRVMIRGEEGVHTFFG